MSKSRGLLFFSLFIITVLPGCGLQWGAEIQWDSKDQILLSERSQVKLRHIQSRTYDTTNKEQLLRAIVTTLQDLYFNIDVLDEGAGIVSGRKLLSNGDPWEQSPSYYRYETDNLISFSVNFRDYGPFVYRTHLARLTVTIRPKGESQLLLRASLQYNLKAVEDPETYQTFFNLVEKSRFLDTNLK